MSHPNEILDFWFSKPDEADYGKSRKVWFTKNPEFDQEVRSALRSSASLSLFLKDYQQAATGQLDDWKISPLSCLALIILFDQFPRNMFRGQPEAFATDPQALAYAKYAIERGFDKELLPIQCWFVYMPFEHSENLADQHKSVELFSGVARLPRMCEWRRLRPPPPQDNRTLWAFSPSQRNFR